MARNFRCVVAVSGSHLEAYPLNVGNRTGLLTKLAFDTFLKQVKILFPVVCADVDRCDNRSRDALTINELKRELIPDARPGATSVQLDIAAHLLKLILTNLPGIPDGTDNFLYQTDIDIPILLETLQPNTEWCLLSCPDAPAKNFSGTHLYGTGAYRGGIRSIFSKRMNIGLRRKF